MTDALNQRSRTAIERIGGTFEGILRKHRPNSGALTTPGQPRNTAAYSITDEEWPSVRARLTEQLGA
jgi:RimJ/RimL family protein N-acetyltransferase